MSPQKIKIWHSVNTTTLTKMSQIVQLHHTT